MEKTNNQQIISVQYIVEQCLLKCCWFFMKKPMSFADDIIYLRYIALKTTKLLTHTSIKNLSNFIRTKNQYRILNKSILLFIKQLLTILNCVENKVSLMRSCYIGKSEIKFTTDFVLNNFDNQNFGYSNKYGSGYYNKISFLNG